MKQAGSHIFVFSMFKMILVLKELVFLALIHFDTTS